MPETTPRELTPDKIRAKYDEYAKRHGDKARSYEDWLKDEGYEDLGRLATGRETDDSSSSTRPGLNLQFNSGAPNIQVNPHIEGAQVHIGSLPGAAIASASPEAPSGTPEPESKPRTSEDSSLRTEIDDLKKQMEELNKKLAEQEERHKKEIEAKDKKIRELEEEIAKLKKEALDEEELDRKNASHDERMAALETEIEPYRKRLVELTVRRKARMTDKYWVRGENARDDAAEYEEALNDYHQKLIEAREAIQSHNAEIKTEAEAIRLKVSEFLTQMDADFKKAEYAHQREILDKIKEDADGPLAKFWARRVDFYKWYANRRTRTRILVGVGAGALISLTSLGLGIGVAGAVVGTTAKISIGLVGRKASNKNVSHHAEKKDLEAIEASGKEREKDKLRRPGDLDSYLDRYLASVKDEKIADVKHAQKINKIGNAIVGASGLLMILGTADALSPGIHHTLTNPFAHHHASTPGAEHKGGLGSDMHPGTHHAGSTGGEGHPGTTSTSPNGTESSPPTTHPGETTTSNSPNTPTTSGATTAPGTGEGVGPTGGGESVPPNGVGSVPDGGSGAAGGVTTAHEALPPNGLHGATDGHPGGVNGLGGSHEALPGGGLHGATESIPSIDNIGNLPPHTHLAELSLHNGNWHDTIWYHVQGQAGGQDLQRHVQEVLELNRDRIMEYAHPGDDVWGAARYLPEHFKFVMPDSFGAEQSAVAHLAGGLTGTSSAELPPLTGTGG